MQKKIPVAGTGRFSGGRLVAELLRQGHRDIRTVDIKPPLGMGKSFFFSPVERLFKCPLKLLQSCSQD